MYYYSNKLPKINDIVFVTIKSFTDNGAYCNLLEYNNLEGLILNSELDKWVKSANKQFEFHKVYPLLVLAISGDKVDLSIKKVKKEDRNKYLEQFGYIDKIKQLVKECVFVTKLDEETVCKLTMWKFFKNNHLETAKNIYNDIIKNPIMFMFHTNGLHHDQFMEFVENMRTRIDTKDVIIGQDFELIICDENAIEKLKEILSYTKPNTEIRYIASPKYQFVVSGTKDFCDNEVKIFTEYMNTNVKKYQRCLFNISEASVIKEQQFTFRKLKID